MNLVFDFGNTRTKGAVFKKDQMVQSFYIDNSEFEKIRGIIKWDEIQKIGITSVINFPESFNSLMKQFNKPIVLVDNKTPLPIRLDYETPATLGADRICNAVAGFMLHPNKNVLIIDLGTCNKYDFIDDSGNYRGGSIAPGYKMRLDAMHQFTANLPLLKPNQISSFIGKSTKTSMETGALWGVIGEINYFVTQYQSQFNDTIVVVTGGYLKIFEKVLKNFIFADPNLTLKGLNSILNYQED